MNKARAVWAWAVNPAVHLKFAKVATTERQRREEVRGDIAEYVADLHKKGRGGRK